MAFRRLRRTGDMNKLSRSLIKIPYELSGGIVIRERESVTIPLFFSFHVFYFVVESLSALEASQRVETYVREK